MTIDDPLLDSATARRGAMDPPEPLLGQLVCLHLASGRIAAAIDTAAGIFELVDGDALNAGIAIGTLDTWRTATHPDGIHILVARRGRSQQVTELRDIVGLYARAWRPQ